MTSDAQKNTGYLLPTPVTGYQPLCVSLLIPDDPTYKAAFIGAITELGKWFNWEKSYEPGDTRASQAATYWRTMINDSLVFEDCNPERSGCIEFAPNSAIIEWFPNDPYLTPNLVPDGYLLPPWYVAPALNLIGLSAGDVGTDFARITSIAGWATQYDVPRFRVNIKGIGRVELHFVNVTLGGLGVIQVDGDLLQVQAVDLQKDIASIPPETASEIVIEINLTTPGDHFIDVQMFPRVDDQVIPIGFGGGLRKVVLCGFDEPCPECDDVPIMRFLPENCMLQYSTNSGATWADVPGWDVGALDCFQGEPGTPGIPGTPGQNCDCDEPPDEDDGGVPTPPGEPSDDKRCRVATKVTESLLDNYFVPLITNYVTDVLNGSLSIQQFLQALLFYANSAIVNLIQLLTIVEIGDDATVVTQANDPDNRNAIKCHLYCAMDDNADITAAVLDQWQADILADTTIDQFLRERFSQWLDSFGLSNIRSEAAIATTTTDPVDCIDCDCSICEEDEKTFDFIHVSEGYTIIAGTQGTDLIQGVQASSTGYDPPYPDLPAWASASNRNAIVRVNLQCLVNRFQVKFKFKRDANPTSAVAVAIYLYDEDNVLLFGQFIGGTFGAQLHNTDLTKIIDVPGSLPVCVQYALVRVGYDNSTLSQSPYVELQEVKTFLT